jgi:rhodanese-related sulfurtransferase
MKASLSIAAMALLALAACGDSTTAVAERPQTDDTAVSLALPEASFALASPQQAAEIIDAKLGAADFVLLDVRTAEEYADGHIAGSANVDFYKADFKDSIAALDRDGEYVVYCRSGNRSGQTIALMRTLGFTNVTDIDGGIVSWQADGLPVEG